MENIKALSTIKWITRILSAVIIAFGLPIYFGYGNPLPLINPEYSIYDNTWLAIFPLMFIGLGLGWRYEKTGGYLITVPILAGFIIGFIFNRDLSPHMIIPFFIGALYLFTGYAKGKIRYQDTKET